MLAKKLPHLLLTLLVGLIVSCGASNPMVKEASSNIESKNYEQALSAAEKSIKQYPGDPLGYYYKAVALGEIAGEKEDPAARADFYKRMNEAFETAKTVDDTVEANPDEINRISAVKNVLWQTEHNRGVKLATDDSLKKAVENPLGKAVQHLENATIIQPDSLLSWNVLSQVAAMNKNFERAASAKEHYVKNVVDTTLTPNDYIQWASYHYQLDNQQKIVEIFEKAQKQFPKNEKIVSNLADAYNRIGEPEKAISAVEKLVNQYPDNARYHQVLGTQIYQQALKLNDELSANSDSLLKLERKLREVSGKKAEEVKQKISTLEQKNQQLRPRIENLTERAEKQLKKTVELDADNASAYNILGVIYQNRAKAVWDMRNRTEDNEKAQKLDQRGRQLLKQAMKYYEKAAEIEPENKDYWRSLFSVYTSLGMEEKAKEAMKKAGMQ